MNSFYRWRRVLYTFDPALLFIDTLWRTIVCMLCIFMGTYLIGPYLHISSVMAIGAAGGLMPVAQHLAGARSKREVAFQTISGYSGVLAGGLLMLLMQQYVWLQVVFVIGAICLHFKWDLLHKTYGQAAVQALMGAMIMGLIATRFIKDINHFIFIYFQLTFIIFLLMSVLMILVVRYPSQVLIDAKISLRYAHEYAAICSAKLLRRPTRRREQVLDRAIYQNHRCAVATEAAMVGIVHLPAVIGEGIHRSAFNSDLLFMRLARVMKTLAKQEGTAAEKIRAHLAQIMDLLSTREPETLMLATDLAGGFHPLLENARQELDPQVVILLKRIPGLVTALLCELVEGGLLHAQADAWVRQHLRQLREAQRRKDNEWFLRPWLHFSYLFGTRVADRMKRRIAPYLPNRESWVPYDLDQVAKILGNLESDKAGKFATGFNYAELDHAGAGAAASKAAGKLCYGPVAIGLSGRHVLQALVSVSLASVVGYVTSGNHFFWASFGAFSVLIGTTTTSSRFRKTLKRVIGTAVGAVIGYAVVWATGSHSPFLNLLIASFFAALAFTIVRRNYTAFSMFLTATIMQIYLLAAAPLLDYAVWRVVDNAVGALIAGIVATFVFPLHTSDVVRSLLGTLEESICMVLEDVKAVIGGQTEVRPMIDGRNVENAAQDITHLVETLLGRRAGTSNSWVRRVASRVPAVAYAVADVSAVAEELRAEINQNQLEPHDTQLTKQTCQIVDLVINDVHRLSVIAEPEDAGQKIGAPGEFVFHTETLLVALQAETEAGSSYCHQLERVVNELVRVDEAIRNLIRKAWG